MVLPACLQFLYLRYQVFFLAGEANFCKNACWNPPQLPIQPFTSSYHLAAAPTRYPPIIWKRQYSVHIFALAIQLNLSNHSFGSSVSVPLNSLSFTKLPSLGAVGGKIVRFSFHYSINTRAFTKCRTFLVPRFLSLSSRLLPFTRRSTDLITMTSLSQRRIYLATRSVRLRLKSII